MEKTCSKGKKEKKIRYKRGKGDKKEEEEDGAEENKVKKKKK